MSIPTWFLARWRALQNKFQALDQALWPSSSGPKSQRPVTTSSSLDSAPPGFFEWQGTSYQTLRTTLFFVLAKAQSRGHTCVWVTLETIPSLQEIQSHGIAPNTFFVVQISPEHNGWELITQLLQSQSVDWLVLDHLSSWVLCHPPSSPQEAFVRMQQLRTQAQQFSCRIVWVHVPDSKGAPKEYTWLRNELQCQATKLIAESVSSL